MTFIGISCTPDRAELVTDSVGYTPDGTIVQPVTKVRPFLHCGTLMTASGGPKWSAHAQWLAQYASEGATNFDDFVAGAPRWLADARTDAGIEPGDRSAKGTIYLIGYSDKLATYVAYAFYSIDPDLTPTRLDDVFLTPAPFDLRPSIGEATRVGEGIRAVDPDAEVDLQEFHDTWMARPPAPQPTSDQDWVNLAAMARGRSLEGIFLRVWIGGDLWHTSLQAGAVVTRHIATFNDHGDELRAMFVESLHPLGQWAPCGCGSDQPLVECHFAPALAEACECGSGKLFADCHLRDRSAEIPDSIWVG